MPLRRIGHGASGYDGMEPKLLPPRVSLWRCARSCVATDFRPDEGTSTGILSLATPIGVLFDGDVGTKKRSDNPSQSSPDAAAAERQRREGTCMYWINCSNRLMAAAGSLWYCMDRYRETEIAQVLGLDAGFSIGCSEPVFRMLCGLSIEVLLKAVILAQTRQVPEPIHDLSKLARAAKWKPSEADALLLRFLNIATVWDGKYPVPLKTHSAEMRERVDLEMAYLTKQGAVPTDLNWDSFNRLRGELLNLLYAACPDGRFPDAVLEEFWRKKALLGPEPQPPEEWCGLM